MTIKNAIEHLNNRLEWLTIKADKCPTHHYIRGEKKAIEMAIEILQKQLNVNKIGKLYFY